MQLRIFTEPQQGATHGTLLRMAKAAEDGGFDAFFRSDHFLGMGGGDHRPGPSDAWLTLAALARETSRIRLGTLLTSATFRLPGLLAVQVAQVDEMSGGRVELGLGAGWFEAEHRAHGVPFPETRERFDRLAEQLAIVTGMWATPEGGTFDFAGEHYELRGCPALPRPVQRPRPPIIVGGHGQRRTPQLAAAHADEFNIAFAPLDAVRAQFARVRRACEAAGRDPGTLALSAAVTVCCGADRAETERRAEAIGHSVEALVSGRGVAGTPEAVLEQIGALADAGAARLYLQVLDLHDLDHVALLAERVLPHVR
ncbi:MAG: TIGR03560 family F420-dependent LLM class oxidoreductase [Frankiaceae bacterium]